MKMSIDEKITIEVNLNSNEKDIVRNMINLLTEMSRKAYTKCKGEADNIIYIIDQLNILTQNHYYDMRTEEDKL